MFSHRQLPSNFQCSIRHYPKKPPNCQPDSALSPHTSALYWASEELVTEYLIFEEAVSLSRHFRLLEEQAGQGAGMGGCEWQADF